MNANRIYNTGFNPDINAHVGTSIESPFYEITAKKDNLSAVIMNEQVIIEEDLYLADELILERDNQMPGIE